MGVSERLFNLAVGAVTVSKKQGLLAVRPVREPRAVPGQDWAWRAAVQTLGRLFGDMCQQRGGHSPGAARSPTRASGPSCQRVITEDLKPRLCRPSLANFPDRQFTDMCWASTSSCDGSLSRAGNTCCVSGTCQGPQGHPPV